MHSNNKIVQIARPAQQQDALPPYSEKAESALLSSLIHHPGAIDKALEIGISPSDFFIPQHPYIFRAALSLKETGKEIDLMTLIVELSDRGTLEQAGGQARLGELFDDHLSSHVEDYCKIVKEKAEKRTAIKLLNEKIAELHKPKSPPAKDLIDSLAKELGVIVPKSEKEDQQIISEELTLTRVHYPSPATLSTLLDENLYRAIKLQAEGFGVPTAVMAIGVLMVFGSQLKADTKVILNRGTKFAVRGNWQAVGISESGTMKSPLFEAAFEPLNLVQQGLDEDYKAKLEAYKNEENPEGSAPKPTELFLDNFTIESLAQALEVRPNLLLASDEVSGIINGLGQYQSGKSNARQNFLKILSNGSLKVNRKTTGRISIPRTSVSMWGMTQPSVWKRDVMTDLSEDGLAPRIALYAIPKSTGVKYSDESVTAGGVDISEYLAGIYKDIASLPASEITLSREAKRVWMEWDAEIFELDDREPDSRIRPLYAKAKSRAAAIALGSHMSLVARGGAIPPEISAETLKAAIAFTKWLLAETRSLYADWGIGVQSDTSKIASLQRKLEAKRTGDGWVNVRFVQRSLNLKTAESAKELMTDMIRRGLAEGRENPKLEIKAKTYVNPMAMTKRQNTEISSRHSLEPMTKPMTTPMTSPEVYDKIPSPVIAESENFVIKNQDCRNPCHKENNDYNPDTEGVKGFCHTVIGRELTTEDEVSIAPQGLNQKRITQLLTSSHQIHVAMATIEELRYALTQMRTQDSSRAKQIKAQIEKLTGQTSIA